MNNYDCRKKGLELSADTLGSDHYKSADQGAEPLDIAIKNGTFMGFCLCSIIKYADRYNRTKNTKDLLKIADYAHLALGHEALKTPIQKDYPLNFIPAERAVKGCGMIIYDPSKESILLGRRTDGQGWCLPGGKIEAGETPLEAAIRETKEEVYIEVTQAKGLGIIESVALIDDKRTPVRSHIYIAEDYPEIKKLNWCAEEFSRASWFTRDEVNKYFEANQIFAPTVESLILYGWLKEK